MIPVEIHDKYMLRCLELARKGIGKTGSNPLVGSVIVHDGRIIGEGYHHEFGGPHAEVNAINSVADKSLLPSSTIYVSLEPCSHYGKTPPCSLLIRDSGIPGVVVGSSDPNPQVAGQGIKMLKDAGVDVVEGVMQDACEWMNRRFFKFITTGKPWVILKWAESSDGFLDKERKESDGAGPNWITNQTARILVHKWRSEEAGIMAGVNTIFTDNPRLDVRDWTGDNPVRIIIDRNDRIGDGFHIKDRSVPTLVFTSDVQPASENLEYINPSDNFSLDNILKIIGGRGIPSVIVEGGALLINSFLDSGEWDEARVFTGKARFRSGVRAPVIRKDVAEEILYRNNLLRIYQRSDL